jgi:hypothetical protein
MSDLKKMYHTLNRDSFPADLTLTIGEPDHPLRQEDLEHRRRAERPALRRKPGPARGPLRSGGKHLRHGRRGLPAGPAQARLGPDRGEPDPVGQAPGQDQPDRRGQRHQHAPVPDGQARGHHPQAQQPLRRGLVRKRACHGPDTGPSPPTASRPSAGPSSSTGPWTRPAPSSSIPAISRSSRPLISTPTPWRC